MNPTYRRLRDIKNMLEDIIAWHRQQAVPTPDHVTTAYQHVLAGLDEIRRQDQELF